MSIGEAVRSVLSQYATFDGRARRSEYWWWTLAYSVVTGLLYAVAAVLATTDPAGDPGAPQQDIGAGGVAALVVFGLIGLLSLALFLPSLAVLVRRLHDTGRSGWWYFIAFVPFVGPIVLLVFEVMDSTPGPNAYGPNPKGVGGDAYGYGAPTGYAQPGSDPRFGTPPAS